MTDQKFKYKFEVIYQTKEMKLANRFLDDCDVDSGKIGIKEKICFTASPEKDIQFFKELIKQAFESCEMELLHIEGGKIE